MVEEARETKCNLTEFPLQVEKRSNFVLLWQRTLQPLVQ